MKGGKSMARRERKAEVPSSAPLDFTDAPAPADEAAHYDELAYAAGLERLARVNGWRDV